MVVRCIAELAAVMKQKVKTGCLGNELLCEIEGSDAKS